MIMIHLGMKKKEIIAVVEEIRITVNSPTMDTFQVLNRIEWLAKKILAAAGNKKKENVKIKIIKGTNL